MSFQPGVEDFEERVRKSFERQKVMAMLGAELTRIEPGAIEITMPFREDLTQQHGYLHAGVVATILDSACGYAAFSLMPADAAVLAVEYKVNFLAPAKGEFIVARGRVERPGRTVTVCTGDAFAVNDGEEKRVTTMLSTIMTITGRDIND